MFIGKKADIGIIALSILIIIAAAILIVPATGEDVITGDVVAEGDIGILVHSPRMALSPDIANCNDIPTTFTVNIENEEGEGYYDIYNVKIYKALTNIVTLTCGSSPTGWVLGEDEDGNELQYGLYCEYKTNPNGNYTIDTGNNLNFTFNAALLDDDDCVTTFRITTLDNEAIITGTGNGSEINTFLDLKVDCESPITNKTLGWPKKEDGNLEWINSITNITLNATDMSEECQVGVNRTYYKNILAADIWNCGGGNCEEEPCRDVDICEGLAEYAYDPGFESLFGAFEVYHDPFSKHDEPESCHILYYYSEDNLGNKEDIKTNCFFVDKTPPIGTKEVGTPRIPIPEEFQIIGDGTAEWTDLESYIGDYSARLYVIDGTRDIAAVEFDVDIALEDITDLSFWQKIANTYGVNIILGIDADGDGVYESQDKPWHFSHNPVDLGDDSFIEMDGLAGSSGNWEEVDTLDISRWWTPNNAGDGFCPEFGWNYLSGIQSSSKCRIDPKDHVKVIRLLIGGSGTWMDKVAFVDDITLNEKIIKLEPRNWWVRDHVTPITLTCTDPEPHPSGDEEVCYKVSFGDGYLTNDYCKLFGGKMEDEWCCADVSEGSYIFNFTEDSLHDLEYFCRDAVNKTSGVDTEWFIVDSQPPIINKTMIGNDHLGDCPPDPEPSDDVCYVRDYGQNGIRIDVEDDDSYGHAVGGVECSYELWWEASERDCEDAGGDDYDDWCLIDDDKFSDYAEIYFEEDSNHTLKIWCEDDLGNEVYDEEEFLVDSTPPETTKTYGEPYKAEPKCKSYYEEWCNYNEECVTDMVHKNCPQWITGGTPITLTADDEKVGVDRIYWADTIAPNEACWEPEQYCQPLEIQMNEVLDDEVIFYKGDEESCHLIQYYAVDKLGNKESLKWQCVFVDNTAPESFKEHGEPLIEDERFDWVTQNTEIELWCEDPEPHPVEQETLCYKVSLDEDIDGDQIPDDNGIRYLTNNYCSRFGGAMEEEWCCEYLDGDSYLLNFMEETYHNLEYYCKDHLENAEEPEIQWYKVDDTAPHTEKIIEPGPYIENGVEWIDTANEIILDARDDVGPHDSGVNKTWYMNILAEDTVEELKLSVDPEKPCWEPDFCNIVLTKIKNNPDHPYFDGKWQLYGGPFQKDEESCHVLVYYSVDNLGNAEDMNVNCFFVDKTPPVTSKEYGEPNEEHEGVEWINSETEVILDPEDQGQHPSGVKATYWRNEIVEDGYCLGELDCEPIHTYEDGGWNPYTVPFTKDRESCHMIEFYSVDNVDKKEEIKAQCVFVDNTPPTPVKEVGEPKTKWDGEDSDFYPWIAEKCWNDQGDQIDCWKVTLDTPISMTCTDPDPHPVDNERICFNVELDGEDYTDNEEYSYCDEYSGDMEGDYCCLDKTIEEFYFLESSEHNLKFYCEDALENRGDIDEEKFKVEGNDFVIELNKKWNLISVPVVLLNPDITEVIPPDSMNDTIVSVWAYDPTLDLCGDEWCVYTPDGNDMNDDLHELIPGWGYWVLSLDETEIVIGGSLLSPRRRPPSRDLVDGWNLIGYYGMNDEDRYDGPYGNGEEVACALGTLCGPLWFEEWGSVVTYWQPYSDDPWVYLGRYEGMDPGAGYWVFMRDEGEYSKATSCCSFFGP